MTLFCYSLLMIKPGQISKFKFVYSAQNEYHLALQHSGNTEHTFCATMGVSHEGVDFG